MRDLIKDTLLIKKRKRKEKKHGALLDLNSQHLHTKACGLALCYSGYPQINYLNLISIVDMNLHLKSTRQMESMSTVKASESWPDKLLLLVTRYLPGCC